MTCGAARQEHEAHQTHLTWCGNDEKLGLSPCRRCTPNMYPKCHPKGHMHPVTKRTMERGTKYPAPHSFLLDALPEAKAAVWSTNESASV